jgi:hypothetical protein
VQIHVCDKNVIGVKLVHGSTGGGFEFVHKLDEHIQDKNVIGVKSIHGSTRGGSEFVHKLDCFFFSIFVPL